MSEQSNLQIVQQAYAAFSRADITSLIGLLSDDVSWYLPGPPETIPFVGQRNGKVEVAQFFATLAEVEDAERFEPQQFVVQGEKVIALGSYKWRVKTTGRTYESDFAHVFTVREGNVVSFQEYYDTAATAAAFSNSAQVASA
jgi:uncharacterized protein